jgi:hypothetical protein
LDLWKCRRKRRASDLEYPWLLGQGEMWAEAVEGPLLFLAAGAICLCGRPPPPREVREREPG